METFEVHPKSVKHLLRLIHERELALPDFQRDSSGSRARPSSLLFMAYKSETFSPAKCRTHLP